MDFGLAKRAADDASRMTMEGDVVGTPAYMAPEQRAASCRRWGRAADQYSVGVVLYEMLCGQTPYKGDARAVISHVGDVNESLPPLRVDAERDPARPRGRVV